MIASVIPPPSAPITTGIRYILCPARCSLNLNASCLYFVHFSSKLEWRPQIFVKLSFTIIQVLHSSFVECESFLESNHPDILALCETNLDDSIDFGNFCVKGYLPLIQKDSITHMHGLSVYVKEELPFAWDLSLENSADSYLCFKLALLHSHFFFLYRSPSLSLCMVFDSISSNIGKVLLISSSANVFVFGDFNVHYKSWLTYSGGTDRPGELL